MKTKKMITVNVFNVSHIDSKNYITSIEIPKYQYIGCTLKALKNYVKTQAPNDSNNLNMRFYVFYSNTFLIKETDLNYIK
jgi:hypothetical protein